MTAPIVYADTENSFAASLSDPAQTEATGQFLISDADGPFSPHLVTVTAQGSPLGTLTATLLNTVDDAGDTGQIGWAYVIAPETYAALGAGEIRSESFDLLITDAAGDVMTQTVTITLTGINDAPTSALLLAPSNEDAAPVTLDLLQGAVDPDGDPVIFGEILNVDSGLIDRSVAYLDNGDGTLTLDPAQFSDLALGETLDLVISYTLTDGTDTSLHFTTLRIEGRNDAPVMMPHPTDITAATVTEAGTMQATGTVVAADIDAGNTVTAAVASVTLSGSVGALQPADVLGFLSVANAGGQIIAPGDTLGSLIWAFAAPEGPFDHLAVGQNLTLTYGITLDDGAGGTVNQDVTITITGSNDAPTLSVPAANIVTDTPELDSFADITGQFIAADIDQGDTLLFSLPDAIANGAVAGYTHSSTIPLGTVYYNQTSGAYLFRPNPTAVEGLRADTTVSLAVTVTDNNGGFSSQPLILSFAGANDAPVAVDDTGPTVNENLSGAAFVDIDVRANDSDRDHAMSSQIIDVLSETIQVTASNAAIAGLEPEELTALFSVFAGAIRFTPGKAFDALNAGETATITLNYLLKDPLIGQSAPATVVFTVTGTNDAPIATARMTAVADKGSAPISIHALQGVSDADYGAVLTVLPPSTLPDGVSYDAATQIFTLDPHHPSYPQVPVGSSIIIPVAFGVSDGTVTTARTLNFVLTGDNENPGLDGTAPAPASYSEPDVGNLTLSGTLSRDGSFDVYDIDPDSVLMIADTDSSGTLSAADITTIRSAAVFQWFGTDGTTVRAQATGTSTNLAGLPKPNTATGINGSNFETFLNAAARASILNAFDITGVTQTDTTLTVNWSFDNDISTGIAGITIDTNSSGNLPTFVATIDVNFLAAGERLVITFPVTVTDEAGGRATVNIPITFTGSNDAPTGNAVRSVFITEGAGLTTRFDNPNTGQIVDNNGFAAGTNNFVNGAHTITVSGTSNNGQRVAYTEPDRTQITGHSLQTIGVTIGGTAAAATLPDSTLALSWFTAVLEQRVGFTAVGRINWSFVAPDAAFDRLAAGETMTITYQLNVRDSGGLVTSGPGRTVTITITGTNDAPVATADARTLDEDASLTGSVVTNDTDPDVSAVASKNILTVLGATGGDAGGPLNGGLNTPLVTPFGTLILQSDGSYSYIANGPGAQALAAGELATDRFTYTVTDVAGGTSTTSLTFTITGQNDAPTVTLQPSDFANAVADETDGTLTASGTLSAADADATDVVQVAVTAVAATGANGGLPDSHFLALLSVTAPDFTAANASPGNITWNFNSGTQAFDFLSEGETLQLAYTITATDDGTPQLNGSHVVTITITGTDDAALITDEGTRSGTLAESDATQTITTSGSFTAADPDAHDVLSASLGTGTVAWQAGGSDHSADLSPALVADLLAGLSLTPVAQGSTLTVNWAYSAALMIDFLALGDVLTITIPVLIAENGSATPTLMRPVTITITGTNDAPQIGTLTAVTATYTESASGPQTLPSTTGSFSYVDADRIDALSASHDTASITLTGPNGLTFADLPAAVQSALTDLAGADRLTISQNLSAATNTLTVDWAYSAGAVDLNWLDDGESLILDFPVTVTDSHGAQSVQMVSVTVNGRNDAPTIGALTAPDTDDNAAPFVVALLQGAADRDDEPLAVLAISTIASTNPARGTLTATLNSDGTASFDPAQFDDLIGGESETVTISYVITDGTAQVTNTLTFTVNGRNDAPAFVLAQGDAPAAALTETDTGLAASGTLTVIDGDTRQIVTAAITGFARNGNPGDLTAAELQSFLTLAANPVIDATAQSGVLGWAFSSGSTAFDHLGDGETLTLIYTVTATDNNTPPASTATTLTITITGSNDAPVLAAALQDQTTAEDAALVFTLPAGTFTDADANTVFTYGASLGDGAALPAWLTFNPASRSFTGTPPDSATGQITLRVTATDPSGAIATASFALTVTNTNDAPTIAAPGDTTSQTDNATITLQLMTGLADDDLDSGDALAVLAGSLTASFAATGTGGVTAASLAAAGGHSSVAAMESALAAALQAGLAPDATLTFLPNSFDSLNALDLGQSITITLAYTVTDLAGLQVTQTARFTVTGALEIITGTPGDDSALMGSGIGDAISGLGGNDSLNAGNGPDDLDGGAGNDTLTAGSGNDTLTGGAGNDVLAGNTGSDEARYLGTWADYLTFGNGASGSLTERNDLDGGGVNTDTLSGIETIRFAGSDGLFGTSDDQAVTSFTAFASAAPVVVAVVEAGTDEDALPATLMVQESATSGDVARITLRDPNLTNPQLAEALSYSLAPLGNTPTGLFALVAGTPDATGQMTLTLRIAPGAVIPQANGTPLTYQLTITDTQGQTATQSLAIRVNDAPTGTPTGTLPSGVEDQPLTILPAALLAGFSDREGDALSVTSLTTSQGSVRTNTDGSFTITPAANVNGVQVLTYTVRDAMGGTLTGQTRNLTFAAVNDAPVAVNDTGAAQAENLATPAHFTLLANDSDADHSLSSLAVSVLSATATSTNSAVNGLNLASAFSLQSNGTLRYTPGTRFDALNAGQTATVSVTYRIRDAANAADDARLTFIVTGADEIITGTSAANRLTGTAYDDRVSAAGGNDTLLGSAGADELGGSTGTDTVDYSASTAAVQVSLTGTGAGGHAKGDTYSGIERVLGSAYADTLTGTTGANSLYGNGSADAIYGGGGGDYLDGGTNSDSLSGGSSNDTLRGNTGADTLNGGTGTDQASYYSDAAIKLSMSGSFAGSGSALGDVLISIENVSGSNSGNDTITGNSGANQIRGNGGADRLDGGAGNDTLIGGAGKDTLTGGSGADTFQYAKPTEGGDIITAFDSSDTFVFEGSAFGLGSYSGTLKTSSFVSRSADTAAQDSSDLFIYNRATDSLWFDSNGKSSGGLTMIADFTADTALSYSDIIII